MEEAVLQKLDAQAAEPLGERTAKKAQADNAVRQ